MPYSRNNYSFVIDSSFRPYTQEEILRPLIDYKNAYDKAEAAYTEYGDKLDKYRDFAMQNPDTEAAQIYNNYANDYNTAFNTFLERGLPGSRRSLLQLKKRYQGEIGILDNADKALQEELKLRRELSAKDPSLLFAEKDLNLNSFLHNKRPNLYSISAEDLRKEGSTYAQAASSRIYSDSRIQDVNKYFQDIIQTQGIRPEILNAWREQLVSIPAFDRAVDDILTARGVTKNLTGDDYETARQSVINGIMEGSVYKEARKTEQNPDVLTRAQAISAAHQDQSLRLKGLESGYRLENGQWIFDPDILKQKRDALGDSGNINWDEWEQSPDGKWHRKPKDSRKSSGTGGSGRSASTSKASQMKKGVRISWEGNDPSGEGYKGKATIEDIASDDNKHVGTYLSYEELPQYAKDIVDRAIKDGRPDLYDYYFQPYESSWINDTEAQLEIVPRGVVTDNNNENSDSDHSEDSDDLFFGI